MNLMLNKMTTQGGVELAQVLNFTPAMERVKLLTKLYNGQFLAQTLGEPQKQPTVTILVEDMDSLDAINQIEASCEVVRVRYRDKIYSGYIVDAPNWDARIRGRAYTAEIKLAVLSEENA